MSQKRTGKRVTMAAIEDDFERAQILDKETSRPRNAHLQWQMSTPGNQDIVGSNLISYN